MKSLKKDSNNRLKLKANMQKDTLEVLKMRGVYGLRSDVMRNFVLDIKVVFCRKGTFSFCFRTTQLKSIVVPSQRD